MTKTLNIPVKLMKRYRKDKPMWELFVFAVCIKCLRGSSGIHPDVMAVRSMMKCSHNKAIRMLERAKRCRTLFYYNEKKNFLVARTFTHGKLEKNLYRSRGKNFIAYSAFCYKHHYEQSETISHIEISRLLRDQLLTLPIFAKQRKNDFLIVAKNSTRSERSKALSVKKLSRIAGLHHTTVSRHIHKLESAGVVSVTRHDYIPVADLRSGEILTDNPALLCRRPFPRRGFLVVKDANEYKLNETRGAFTNVIFNHIRRHSRNYSKLELALAHYDN